MSRDELLAEIIAADLRGRAAKDWEAYLSKTMDDQLDDLVHNLKSMEASDINNGGWESQLDYLLGNGITVEEIREALGLTNAF